MSCVVKYEVRQPMTGCIPIWQMRGGGCIDHGNVEEDNREHRVPGPASPLPSPSCLHASACPSLSPSDSRAIPTHPPVYLSYCLVLTDRRASCYSTSLERWINSLVGGTKPMSPIRGVAPIVVLSVQCSNGARKQPYVCG